MTKKIILLALCSLLLALCSAVEAQQPGKDPQDRLARRSSSFSTAVRPSYSRESLRALGYVEGKNIIFESAVPTKLDRLPALATSWSVSRSTCSSR